MRRFVLFLLLDVQIAVDASIERVEFSAGGEVSPSETDRIREPNEGMTFDSEAAARAFYVEYAGRAGFITRVLSSRKSERDGSIISRGLGCRGIPDTQKIGNAATVKRDRRREGCAAMILIKREKPGTWVDEKDKKIQELTAELRVKKRLSAAYREHLLGIMKDVESHSEHLSSKVQSIRENLRSLDAEKKELLTHERP
nr:protein FAR1-RELATED SEQUENCE 2-like [Ipomoea batatas]